jgi:superfamily I DNA/RNA helicase
MERLRADTAAATASRALSVILEETGYWKWLESQTDTDPESAGRLDNLQALLNSAKEYEEKAPTDAALDLSSYLEAVALHTDLDS